MPDTLFQGIFDTQLTAVIAPEQFLLCVGASLVIGLVLCAMMLWRTRPSTGFAVTLATLPAVVCVVIMMVNGNVGTGVAVAGDWVASAEGLAAGAAGQPAARHTARASRTIPNFFMVLSPCRSTIAPLYNGPWGLYTHESF